MVQQGSIAQAKRSTTRQLQQFVQQPVPVGSSSVHGGRARVIATRSSARIPCSITAEHAVSTSRRKAIALSVVAPCMTIMIRASASGPIRTFGVVSAAIAAGASSTFTQRWKNLTIGEAMRELGGVSSSARTRRSLPTSTATKTATRSSKSCASFRKTFDSSDSTRRANASGRAAWATRAASPIVCLSCSCQMR